MSEVSLDRFKAASRTNDGDYDDGYLQFLLDTAESFVVRRTRRSLDQLLDMGGGALPMELQQAIMLLAANWYEYRLPVDSAGLKELPYAVSALVKPFIRLG